MHIFHMHCVVVNIVLQNLHEMENKVANVKKAME